MVKKSMRPAGLIVKNGKILVLDSNYSGRRFWLLPGGGIEGMETLEETVVREVKEETNYDVEIKKLLYVREWIDKQRDKNVLDIIFLAETISGEETHLKDPCLDKGHIEAIAWKSVDELRELVFFPEGILDYVEKGIRDGFKDGAIYLNPDVVE